MLKFVPTAVSGTAGGRVTSSISSALSLRPASTTRLNNQDTLKLGFVLTPIHQPFDLNSHTPANTLSFRFAKNRSTPLRNIPGFTVRARAGDDRGSIPTSSSRTVIEHARPVSLDFRPNRFRQ